MDSIPQNEELARQWMLAQPTIAAFVASQLPGFHDAQDVLQEVAVVLTRKFAEYDRSRPFLAWAIGIAQNEILAHRRRSATNRTVFDDDLLEQLSLDFNDQGDYLDRFGEALIYCLGRLDGKSRTLIELRYSEDLKPAVIASRVHASANAIAAALYRIRQALRDCAERRLARTGSVSP
jgi:RNA polymerase sigma-70 factor (ECF subfamily)